jgi:phosphatidylserine decarboxylase
VIQIAAKTVSVIDSYYPEGSCLRKGHIFGMTRIGTQVEMVIQFPDDLEIKVRPEERVRSGETVIVTAR